MAEEGDITYQGRFIVAIRSHKHSEHDAVAMAAFDPLYGTSSVEDLLGRDFEEYRAVCMLGKKIRAERKRLEQGIREKHQGES